MAEEIVNFLKAIHLMDILIIVLIGSLAVYGFARGMANVAVLLISTYLGFAIASIYYAPFGRLLGGLLGISLGRVAEIVAFLLLNALMATLIASLLFSVLGNLQLPGRAGACLDRPAGMFVGFACGIIIAAILVIVLSVPFTKFEEVRLAGGQAPLFSIFHFWYRDSWLAPQLAKLGPVMLASIGPLTGQRLPSLISMTNMVVLPLFLVLKLKLQSDEVAHAITVK